MKYFIDSFQSFTYLLFYNLNSRQPSGIISPSEIPDSPSQTMPQSPRQNRRNETSFSHPSCSNRASNQITFEDEMKTFDDENTPALISCATSLSNLSLDDEPKIANDSLIKEMRLMHHLSDEQPDDLPENANATTSQASGIKSNSNLEEQTEMNAGEALSDSDESINDDENDSQLLENYINIGIQAVTRAKNIDPGEFYENFCSILH